eukprot:scaffold129733_cov69-Phaeocystis_antarctica.AAC.15
MFWQQAVHPPSASRPISGCSLTASRPAPRQQLSLTAPSHPKSRPAAGRPQASSSAPRHRSTSCCGC